MRSSGAGWGEATGCGVRLRWLDFEAGKWLSSFCEVNAEPLATLVHSGATEARFLPQSRTGSCAAVFIKRLIMNRLLAEAGDLGELPGNGLTDQRS